MSAEKGVPYVSTSLIRPRKREFLGFETTTEMPVSVVLHRSASEVHQKFEKNGEISSGLGNPEVKVFDLDRRN